MYFALGVTAVCVLLYCVMIGFAWHNFSDSKDEQLIVFAGFFWWISLPIKFGYWLGKGFDAELPPVNLQDLVNETKAAKRKQIEAALAAVPGDGPIPVPRSYDGPVYPSIDGSVTVGEVRNATNLALPQIGVRIAGEEMNAAR